MRFRSHLLRRSATAVGAVALSLGGLALIGGPPAGAVGGPNPPTTAVAYEVDAYNGTAGEGVPLVVTTAGLTLTGGTAPLYPQGATYGLSGSVSYTAIGALLAGLAANGIPLSFSVGGLALSGDGTATGSYTIPTFTGSNFVANTTTVPTVTYSTGSPVITGAGPGAFNAGEVGDGVVGPTGHKTDFQGTQIIAVAADGSTATLSGNPPAAGGSGGSVVLYGPSTLTQLIATPTNAFTTNAAAPWAISHSTTADVNLASAGIDTIGYTIGGALVAGPGAEGNNSPGQNEATITGYTFGNQPGPGIENAASANPGALDCTALPTLPPGSTFPIQSTGCPGSPTAVSFDAASVPLSATGPTAHSATTSLGVGQIGSFPLSCSPGSASPSSAISSFALDPVTNPNSQTANGNTLTYTLNTATGALSLDDSGQAGAASIQINFNCTDALGLTSSDGTLTVSLGTPPVIQPFTEQVNGSTLVLSCSSPATYVTGNDTPTPGGSPRLQCPEFQFQPITLDGLEQQVSTTTGDQSTTTSPPAATSPGTIYISDNRGSPADSWTLTGTFVATAIGSGDGQNPNPNCSGVVAFCNGTVTPLTAVNNTTSPGGVHDGWILPSYLQVSNISCKADSTGGPGGYNPPNLNPDATPTPGTSNFGSAVSLCSASTGQSGGTFLFNATYTLTIPESVYAGNYFGSVQYTVG